MGVNSISEIPTELKISLMNKREIDLNIPKGAIFSDDGKYRYALWRVWNTNRPLLLIIGLNPSKAGALNDDPTVTRGIVRAGRAGFGGLLMANLYAYVSTEPAVLLGDGDYVGELTDSYLNQMIAMSGRQLCGWGSFLPVGTRVLTVLAMIKEPYCLGINADGQPQHPLYISYSVQMRKYIPQGRFHD